MQVEGSVEQHLAPGERVRPVAELGDAFAYLDGAGASHTDILACTLAVHAGVGEDGQPEVVLVRKFLKSVEAMNAALGIPRHLDALREADIPDLARAACWEADTNYPVPRRMTQRDCEKLLRAVLPPKVAPKRAVRKPGGR